MVEFLIYCVLNNLTVLNRVYLVLSYLKAFRIGKHPGLCVHGKHFCAKGAQGAKSIHIKRSGSIYFHFVT